MIDDKPMTAGQYYVKVLEGQVDPSVQHYYTALVHYVNRLEFEIRILRDRCFKLGGEIRAVSPYQGFTAPEPTGASDVAS